MSIDLFQSRRNYNERCRYWVRNESEEYEENELVYQRVPDGVFFAKEVNAETDDKSVIAGTFMINRTRVTIKTPDDLSGLKIEDHTVLVEYQGDLWRISDIQRKKARIQSSEFSSINNVSHYYYLNLIK